MIVSVVFGGKEERDASAKNAKDIADVLSSRGYSVHLLEFSRDIISINIPFSYRLVFDK